VCDPNGSDSCSGTLTYVTSDVVDEGLFQELGMVSDLQVEARPGHSPAGDFLQHGGIRGSAEDIPNANTNNLQEKRVDVHASIVLPHPLLTLILGTLQREDRGLESLVSDLPSVSTMATLLDSWELPKARRAKSSASPVVKFCRPTLSELSNTNSSFTGPHSHSVTARVTPKQTPAESHMD
ncbi:hypothetical protein SKAU_G00218910, partial [Synaphobranchus kaupii]